MEHFYNNIEGWFSYEHLYKEAVEQAVDGALFVEVGCFKGRSSAFMTVEIINSSKNIRFDCVDTWQGSEEHQTGGPCEVKEVVEGTLYDVFIENMKPVEGRYCALRMPSVEAAAQYEDDSIDFIMIDGSHDVDSVVDDIRAWLPKMKNGGIMTGDDANSSGPRLAAERELGKYGVTFPGQQFKAIITK